MKIALLIIDLQKGCVNKDSQKLIEKACNEINKVLPLFRKREYPIIWIQHFDESSGMVPGNKDYEIVDYLKPKEKEYRIQKEYENSFNKTELLKIIKNNNIDTVLISGYCAEYCIISTYKGSLDYDLFPMILKNGIASGNRKNKEFIEETYNTITLEVVEKIFL
jgi:nicotinamidase-related amidase